MDKAKENYLVGKHRTVTVDELEREYVSTVPSSTKRFICRECGEYVSFIRSYIYQSYFKHDKSNETTKKCDLRIQGQQNLSIHEKLGLPIYLKKCGNNNFELYLGFYNIDETLMNIAKREEFKISISPLNEDQKLSVTYFINDNNFSTDSTTLKRINFIAQKYKLEYSSDSAKKLLSIRWGKDTEGILSDGALFTYSELGGRKIKINDEVTTGTDYFYLGKNGNILDRCYGIEYTFCGEMSLKTSFVSVVYNVYKINFIAYNDDQFYKLINFCRDHFKVSLIYKPSALIAMWPPTIQIDNQISYFNKKEALFILKSEEINARVFVHRDNMIDELIGEKIDDNKYLMKIPVITDGVVVNINEKYNSIFAFLTHYKGNIKTFNNSIYMRDSVNNPINRGNYSKIPDKKTIKITAETKCDILHIKKNQIYRNYKINNEEDIIIDNIAFEDEILAISGIEYTFLLKYIENQLQSVYIFNDELVYLNICQLGSPFMTPPIWIKSFLVLLNRNSKTFKVVRKFLLTNKMPVNANKILKEVYKTMKVGVDFER